LLEASGKKLEALGSSRELMLPEKDLAVARQGLRGSEVRRCLASVEDLVALET
jgi:hypothetical protein